MHCQTKKFYYTGEQESIVSFAHVTASVHGSTIELRFSEDKKNDIANVLTHSGIPFTIGKNAAAIKTPLFETEHIQNGLKALVDARLIYDGFAKQISQNYPDGMGRTYDLEHPPVQWKEIEAALNAVPVTIRERRNQKITAMANKTGDEARSTLKGHGGILPRSHKFAGFSSTISIEEGQILGFEDNVQKSPEFHGNSSLN